MYYYYYYLRLQVPKATFVHQFQITSLSEFYIVYSETKAMILK